MKNKTTYFITCLLALMILVIACKKDEKIYHSLPVDKKIIYNTGDLLIYKSNLGNIDTIIVSSYEEYFSPRNKEGEKDFYEWVYIAFDEKISADSSVCKARISQHADIVNRSINNLTWDSITFIYPDDGTPIETLQINTNQYSDVYLFTNDTIGLLPNKLHKVYYSPKYGFLKIENKNGETWELQ